MDSGPHIIELATPYSAETAYIHRGSTPGSVIRAVSATDTATRVRPAMANGFGSCELVSFPTKGESAPEIRPEGSTSSAAAVGENSRTVCT